MGVKEVVTFVVPMVEGSLVAVCGIRFAVMSAMDGGREPVLRKNWCGGL